MFPKLNLVCVIALACFAGSALFAEPVPVTLGPINKLSWLPVPQTQRLTQIHPCR